MPTARTLTLAFILALLALAPAASAETICVGTLTGTCDDTKPGTAAGLTAALADASSQAGADVVRIAPGTYVGTFNYTKNEEVDIVGSGVDQTILESDAFNAALSLTGDGWNTTTASNLGVRMADLPNPQITAGIYLSDAEAQNVKATNPNESTGRGVLLASGGAFRNGTVSVGDAFGVETIAPDGSREVSDTSISGSVGAQIISGSATLERVHMSVAHIGVSSGAATTTVRNTLIRVGGTATSDFGLYQFAAGTTIGEHLTIHGGEGTDWGVLSNTGTAGNSTVNLESSSISGGWFSTFIRDTQSTGEANINVGHSNFADPQATYVDASQGPGSFNETPNGTNTHGDPRYVDPFVTLNSPGTDFRPRYDSPLIDSGENGGAAGTDVDGNNRIVDGDGVDGARRDMGAYEYQREAPTAAIAAPGAGPFTAGLPVPFAATGSTDPDADPLTYAWSFGDGGTAATASGQHTYAQGGHRSIQLTVTDPTGLSDAASREIDVAAAPAGGGGGQSTPKDTLAPALTKASLSKKRFRVRGRRSGSTLRFRLSEAATVRVTIERRKTGRWRKAGALKARKLAAGRRSIRITGKLGKRRLKPGRYRAVLRATDAAGNRSRAARVAFRVIR